MNARELIDGRTLPTHRDGECFRFARTVTPAVKIPGLKVSVPFRAREGADFSPVAR